jgi:prepilin-type N-terminal cleavage/methylation domain-containing protein
MLRIKKKKIDRTNRGGLKKNFKGFSFVEMIIAVAIFAMVMVAVMSAYVSIFKAGKNAKVIQQNMENARGAMELMAKTIRSGEIDGSSANDISLFVFDAGSDKNGKCIRFSFVFNNIQESQTGTLDRTVALSPYCSTASYASTNYLADTSTNFTITGNFAVSPASPTSAGKVTILTNVHSGTDSANLQTTVSLSGSQEVAPN